MRHDQADIFLVPLLDGSHAVGQVLTAETQPVCLLSLRRQSPGETPQPILPAEVIAVHRIGAAHLANDTWPIIGFDQIPRLTNLDQLEAIEGEVLDPAIAEALLNAWHGLYPWDGFPDPAFFDKLLRGGVTRPASARTKGQLA